MTKMGQAWRISADFICNTNNDQNGAGLENSSGFDLQHKSTLTPQVEGVGVEGVVLEDNTRILEDNARIQANSHPLSARFTC